MHIFKTHSALRITKFRAMLQTCIPFMREIPFRGEIRFLPRKREKEVEEARETRVPRIMSTRFDADRRLLLFSVSAKKERLCCDKKSVIFFFSLCFRRDSFHLFLPQKEDALREKDMMILERDSSSVSVMLCSCELYSLSSSCLLEFSCSIEATNHI